MKKKRRIWIIHSGLHGEGHTDFMAKPWISLGWNRVGDLRLLKNNRAAFRAAIEKRYPNGNAATVRMQAGALYRFLYKMQRKDIVIYPSPDGLVYVGNVKGDYEFRLQRSLAHYHVRKVKWFGKKEKEDLSRRVRSAINRSARSSLCQPRQNAQLLRYTFFRK
jgi:restriction system protein